ncbi:MAG TPA: type VI secretion system baseplate subunit TssK [Pirellulales bacterium]
MRNARVHWYEGLFLLPQHFQAADRHWAEVMQTSEKWDHAYNYGLQTLEFSREALAEHQFQVHALQARMRDGTLVSLRTGQEPDRLDLKGATGAPDRSQTSLSEAFDQAAVVRVYLGIPNVKLGRANVASSPAATDTRYLESSVSLHEEGRGGDEQEIQIRELNVQLLLSTQDLSGYDLLPIAQIKRASEHEASPQLDPDYIPPVLCIGAWPGLGRDIVRAVHDIIGQKIEVLSQQISNRGIGLDSRDPGDLDRVMMLVQLNQAHARLSVLVAAQGIPPLTAYLELCGIAGQLSIFSEARRSSEFLPYDHDNLAVIFPDVKRRIEESIYFVRDYEFEQRYFVGHGMGMHVSLEPQWFHSNWQWFIGVNKGDLTQQQCRDLLASGQLDWKLGSARQVELLFTRRAEGVIMTTVDRPIRALPSSTDWVFYEVVRKDASAWRDVQETQTLAMRLKDSMIVNRDRLQGQRQLVVSVNGRQVGLEFALFAVPALH